MSAVALLSACKSGSDDPPTPAPTVTVTASPTSVSRNGTSLLSWTTTNATACTASGAWSGSLNTSGSSTTPPLTLTSTFTLTCTGPGGSGNGSATVTVTNIPPTANAGPDQTVLPGALVTLSGAASSDPDGTIAIYAWSQTSGPAVTLSSTSAVGPTFTAPTPGATTTLVFSLTVTDNSASVSAADSVTVTVQPGVVVSGTITFERIPFRAPPGRGLDYAAMRQDPARGLRVEIVRDQPPLNPVLATTSTDADGRYSMIVPPSTQVILFVHAEMTRAVPQPPPHWRFRVRDFDANTGYVENPAGFMTGAAGSPAMTVNHNIVSGWTTGGLPAPVPLRRAAPFAILDTVYTVIGKMQQVAPTIQFPELVLDWAASNPGGVTFYDDDGGGANRHITIAAEPNVDTDEYDQHVIAHEFGHYLEDRFSRSDSIGGPHGSGDRLDMRVAFGEGFGYAFAGIMLDTSLMRDSVGLNQAQESFFDIESDAVLNPGWYSEASVHHILWDLYDAVPDGTDNVALGFAPIWQNLTGTQRNSDALTSIFSFIPPLKQANAGQAAAIDTLVGGQSIVSTTMDIYGSTETNNAGSTNVLPVYTSIAVSGGARTVNSTLQFGGYNGLGVRRFLRLDATSGASVGITVTGPAGSDPDIVVRRRGVAVGISEAVGNENFRQNLGTLPALLVLEVYEFDYTDDLPPTNTFTPVTVTVTP